MNEHDSLSERKLDRELASIRRHTTAAVVAGSLLFVAGASIATWALPKFSPSTDDLGSLGGFLAGTVAPLWSVAGLSLIYLAFLAQRRQILLQEEAIELNRQELIETRDELRGQKDQLELQKKEMERQTQLALRQVFESNFFQLLTLLRDQAKALRASPTGSVMYEGEHAFAAAAHEMASRLVIVFQPPLSEEQFTSQLTAHFRALCLGARSDFSNYFRTLYHIVRLIHDSADQEWKPRYASLVRAQLSNAELLLLAANGLTTIGRPRFKELIERYRLLEPLRTATPPYEPFRKVRQYYEPEAYGDADPDQ